MIPVDRKGTVFPNQVEITREIVKKALQKENFKKDLMNLIETNHQMNMSSDHSVSSNNSFKSHLNANSFNMLLTL